MILGVRILFSLVASGQGTLQVADTLGPYALEFTEVVPGVVVAGRPDPVRLPVNGNITVIFNQEDVVVVDAGAAPVAARQAIDYIRLRASVPVSTLVITHGHEDHILGIQEWTRAYPGIQVLAHRGTRDYMTSGRLDRVYRFADGVEERRGRGLDQVQRIRTGTAPGGGALAAHLERFYERDLDVELAEYAMVSVTPPNATFLDRVVLHRVGRTIEIMHRPGKTDSDAVVHLPEEGVLIVGDILTHPIPYGFAARPAQWLDALRWIDGMEFQYLVPGHGDVLTDKTHLRRVIELVDLVNGEVAQAVAEGLDFDAITERINLDEARRGLIGDHAVLAWYFDRWYTDPAVQRRYAELSTSRAR